MSNRCYCFEFYLGYLSIISRIHVSVKMTHTLESNIICRNTWISDSQRLISRYKFNTRLMLKNRLNQTWLVILSLWIAKCLLAKHPKPLVMWSEKLNVYALPFKPSPSICSKHRHTNVKKYCMSSRKYGQHGGVVVLQRKPFTFSSKTRSILLNVQRQKNQLKQQFSATCISYLERTDINIHTSMLTYFKTSLAAS